MNKFLFSFTAICLCLLTFSSDRLSAETPEPGLPFELVVGEGWKTSESPYQGVAASYALQGTGARLDVSVQGGQKETDVGVLSWQDLFYPQFDVIDIQMDARTTLDGLPAKYCLYKVRKSSFKKQLEGKRDLMYLNYVILKAGRLYSLTFSDDEASFSQNQPAFMKMIRTLRLKA